MEKKTKTAYNYWCLNSLCNNNKLIQRTPKSEDSNEYCVNCREKLKMVGIATNIVHKGTTESKY